MNPYICIYIYISALIPHTSIGIPRCPVGRLHRGPGLGHSAALVASTHVAAVLGTSRAGNAHWFPMVCRLEIWDTLETGRLTDMNLRFCTKESFSENLATKHWFKETLETSDTGV